MYEPLFSLAVCEGDLAALRFLCRNITDSESKRHVFQRANLRYAAGGAVIEYMLTHHPGEGWHSEKDLMTAVIIAAETGNLKVLALLAKQYPDATKTTNPLKFAIGVKNWSAMKWLVANNVITDTSRLLLCADDINVFKWARKRFPHLPIDGKVVEEMLEMENVDILTYLASEFPNGIALDYSVDLQDQPPHLHDWLRKCMKLTEAECPVCWETKPVLRGTCKHSLCRSCHWNIERQGGAGVKCPLCRAAWKTDRDGTRVN